MCVHHRNDLCTRPLSANTQCDKVFYWPHIYYSWRYTHTPSWMVQQWDSALDELSDYNHASPPTSSHAPTQPNQVVRAGRLSRRRLLHPDARLGQDRNPARAHGHIRPPGQGVYQEFGREPLATTDTHSTPKTRQHGPVITRVTRVSTAKQYCSDPGHIQDDIATGSQ